MVKVKKIKHTDYHCPICTERFMNVIGQPLENHSQVKCITNNNDEINIGICIDCQKKADIETLNSILEGIKDYWEEEAEKTGHKEETKKQMKENNQKIIIKEIHSIINTIKKGKMKGGIL